MQVGNLYTCPICMLWLRGGGGEEVCEEASGAEEADDPLQDTRPSAGHGSYYPDEVAPTPNPNP